MAVDVNVETIPFIAGEDMEGHNYEILKYNASGRAVRCTVDADLVCGVCYIDIPTRDATQVGQALPMAPISQPAIIKVKAGGALTRGHLAVPDGTNDGHIKGVANVAAIPNGVTAIGQILDAATAKGQIVRIQPFYVASAADA